METNRQNDAADTDMLLERIRTLELEEKMHLDRRNAWKKIQNELDATLRLRTGELAVLSEMWNSYLNEGRRAGGS